MFELLQCEDIGMGVTECLAMTPAASVSGFYLGHPDSTYFSVGKIGADQLKDLAARRHMNEQALQRLLAPNLSFFGRRRAFSIKKHSSRRFIRVYCYFICSKKAK